MIAEEDYGRFLSNLLNRCREVALPWYRDFLKEALATGVQTVFGHGRFELGRQNANVEDVLLSVLNAGARRATKRGGADT